MKMDIFIRTYHKDAQWLIYLLRSIRKYCSGYNEFIVACPISDLHQIRELVDTHGTGIRSIRLVITEDDYGNGYMAQQHTKMMADTYSNADYIGFVDSDCIFVTRNSPETWMVGDKIRYLITHYSSLGDTVPWKGITEKALRFECPFETMRRHPCVFPREVITHCREYMEKIHGKPLKSYIYEQPNGSFSEFNVMGSYARQMEPEKFMFVDTAHNPLPPEILKQRWSYGGITPEIAAENDRILL